MSALTNEVYDFCPDIIGQHFSGFGEMADSLEDDGEPLSATMRELLEGVSWDDEEAGGVELFEALTATRPCHPVVVGLNLVHPSTTPSIGLLAVA